MRSNEVEGSLTDRDLEEISDMLESINDGGRNLLGIQSNSHLSAHAASAVAAAGMEMSRDNDDEYERWLRIKLNLDDNIRLKEENEKLKGMLESAESDFKLKEHEMNNKMGGLEKDLSLEKGYFLEQQRELNEMKGFMKKLYSAAGAVLEGLGGEVLPFREIDEGEGLALVIEQFCEDIETKWVEWQENHQLMHNELEKTLKIVEGLAEGGNEPKEGDLEDSILVEDDVADGEEGFPSPAQSGSVFIPSTRNRKLPNMGLEKESALALGLSRRNHLRKCRLLSNSNSYDDNTACWDHLSENSQFACEHCGDAFCRLAHVHSQLVKLQSNNSTGTGATTKPGKKSARKARPKNGFRKAKKGKGAKRFRPASENEDDDNRKESNGMEIVPESECNAAEFEPNDVRLKLVVVDSDQQEHKFIGISTTNFNEKGIRPNGISSKRRRYLCKCGKDYAAWPALYHHMKSIDTGHYIICEECHQEFEIHNALKAHMMNAHGKKYVQQRFPCLECDQKFTTKKQMEAHRELHHTTTVVEVENGNSDSDDEGALIIDEDYHST